MAALKSGLILGVPPQRGNRAGPDRPSLIANHPFARPMEYGRLADLARAVQRLRTAGGIERGLELVADHAIWNGSDSFPVFKVLAIHDVDASATGEHVATIAVQGASLERVMAAIADANPTAPAAARRWAA